MFKLSTKCFWRFVFHIRPGIPWTCCISDSHHMTSTCPTCPAWHPAEALRPSCLLESFDAIGLQSSAKVLLVDASVETGSKKKRPCWSTTFSSPWWNPGRQYTSILMPPRNEVGNFEWKIIYIFKTDLNKGQHSTDGAKTEMRLGTWYDGYQTSQVNKAKCQVPIRYVKMPRSPVCSPSQGACFLIQPEVAEGLANSAGQRRLFAHTGISEVLALSHLFSSPPCNCKFEET